MTWYDKSAARYRRTKRKQYRRKMLPYEAECLSTRARHAWPKTKARTRFHPREWGHFGKKTREDDVA